MYTHVHTGKDFGEPISRGEMHKNWWSKLSNWATYERAVKKLKSQIIPNILIHTVMFYLTIFKE